jgi:hypothetical protein
MNKLIDAINIITALGWSKQLDDESWQAMQLLRETAKDKSDNELTPEEMVVVDFVNKLLSKNGMPQ